MRLIRIIVEKFRSFEQKQEFIFPRAPGLYYLTGFNELQPELGANGVGKSTLWDAVTWCLFGKTVRGLSASDICSWYSSKPGGVLVQLELEVRGKRLQVRRTWKPNSLQLITPMGPRNVAQEELEQLIGSSLLSFLNSVMFGQFSQTFLDLDPSKKEHVLCSALGLNVWLDYSKAASATVSRLTAKERDNHGDLRHLEGSLQTLQRQAETQVDDDMEHFIRVELENGRHSRDDSEKALRIVGRRLKKKEAAREYQLDLIAEQESVVAEYQEAYENTYNAWKGIKLKYEYSEEAYQELSKQTTGKCTVCGQKLTRAHRDKELLRRSIESQDLWDKTISEDASRKAALDKLNEEKETLTRYKRSDRDLVETLNKLNRKLDTCAADNQRAKDLIRRKRKELANLRTRKEEAREKLEQDLGRLRHHLSNAKVTGHLLAEQIHYSRYWVSGFRDIRLFLMEDALNQLERSVNNAMSNLGLEGWKLEFTTKRTTKKGDVTGSRLDVFITAPGSSTRVPWAAWSGGESQRIRLAGAMGLSELIGLSTGNRLGLEIWDEPTSWLSKEGVDDLVLLLRDRAIRERKVIWLVDHRTLGDSFDGVWSVVKTGTGSRIQRIGG